MLYFKKKTIKRILLLCYLTLLLLLYLSPTFSTDNPAQLLIQHIPHMDKVSHFILFLLLSHLCFIQTPPHDKRGISKLFTLVMLLSIGLEFTHLLIRSRQFEWADMGANISGLIIYTGYYLLKTRKKRSQS
jgi:hypothetical protein